MPTSTPKASGPSTYANMLRCRAPRSARVIWPRLKSARTPRRVFPAGHKGLVRACARPRRWQSVPIHALLYAVRPL